MTEYTLLYEEDQAQGIYAGREKKTIRSPHPPQIGDIISLDQFTHLEVVRRSLDVPSGELAYVVRYFKRNF